jgi:hypothetical protein
MDLSFIKKELKERMALGLNYGIQAVEEIIAAESIHANEIVNYKSQYNDLNRIASQNILDYAQIEMGLNKIRMGLLDLIDRLEVEDLTDQQELPEVQNRDLQYRKNNFFQLLDIHFANLEQVKLEITYSAGPTKEIEVKTGREAMDYIYDHYVRFPVKDRKLDVSGQAGIDYIRNFFKKYTKLEVYMKTVGFIIDYIREDPVEQHFFKGVFKSILSTPEVALIFYCAAADVIPGFKKTITESGLIDDAIRAHLLQEDHFTWL